MSNVSRVGVSLSIDVTKIQKERLSTGEKGGKWLNATVFVDVDDVDKFGNSGMITQDVTKEERDQGKQGYILGNCKVFWKKEEEPSQPAPQTAPQQAIPSFDDDIPF